MKNYYQITNKLSHLFFKGNQKNLFGNNLEHVKYSSIPVSGITSAVNNFFVDDSKKARSNFISGQEGQQTPTKAAVDNKITDERNGTVIRSQSELEGMLKGGAFGRTIDLRNSQISPEVYMALSRGEEVNVTLQQLAPERANLLTPLFASAATVFMSMGGGVAYNEKLMDALQGDLSKAATFVDKHGLSYGMGMGLLGGLLGAAEHVDVIAKFDVVNKKSDDTKINLDDISYIPQRQLPKTAKENIESYQKRLEEEIQLQREIDSEIAESEYTSGQEQTVEFTPPQRKMMSGLDGNMFMCARNFSLPALDFSGNYNGQLLYDAAKLLNGTLNENRSTQALSLNYGAGSDNLKNLTKLINELGIKDSSGTPYTEGKVLEAINQTIKTPGSNNLISRDKTDSEWRGIWGKVHSLSQKPNDNLDKLYKAMIVDSVPLNSHSNLARGLGDSTFRTDVWGDQRGAKGMLAVLNYGLSHEVNSTKPSYFSESEIKESQRFFNKNGENILHNFQLHSDMILGALNETQIKSICSSVGIEYTDKASASKALKNLLDSTVKVDSDLTQPEFKLLNTLNDVLSDVTVDKKLKYAGKYSGELQQFKQDLKNYLENDKPLFEQVVALNEIQKARSNFDFSTKLTFASTLKPDATKPYNQESLVTAFKNENDCAIGSLRNALGMLKISPEEIEGLFTKDANGMITNVDMTQLDSKLPTNLNVDIKKWITEYATEFNSYFGKGGTVDSKLAENQATIDKNQQGPQITAFVDVAQIINGDNVTATIKKDSPISSLTDKQKTDLMNIVNTYSDKPELKTLVDTILKGGDISALPDNIKALIPTGIEISNLKVGDLSAILSVNKEELLNGVVTELEKNRIPEQEGAPKPDNSKLDNAIANINGAVKDETGDYARDIKTNFEALQGSVGKFLKPESIDKFAGDLKQLYSELKEKYGVDEANNALAKMTYKNADGVDVPFIPLEILTQKPPVDCTDKLFNKIDEIAGKLKADAGNEKKKIESYSSSLEESIDKITQYLTDYNNPNTNTTSLDIEVPIFENGVSTGKTETLHLPGDQEKAVKLLENVKSEFFNVVNGKTELKPLDITGKIDKLINNINATDWKKTKEVPFDEKSINEFSNGIKDRLSKLSVYLDMVKSGELSRDKLPDIINNIKNLSSKYSAFILNVQQDINKIKDVDSIQSIATQISSLKMTAQALYTEGSSEWGEVAGAFKMVDDALSMAKEMLGVINGDIEKPVNGETIPETKPLDYNSMSYDNLELELKKDTNPAAQAKILNQVSPETAVKFINSLPNIDDKVAILNKIDTKNFINVLNKMPDEKEPILDKISQTKVNEFFNSLDENESITYFTSMNAQKVADYFKSLPEEKDKEILNMLLTIQPEGDKNISQQAIDIMKLLGNERQSSIMSNFVEQDNLAYKDLAKGIGINLN